MSKLVVTEFLTLDGVFEAPHTWPTGYFNDEIGLFKFDELNASDSLLLGRITYEEFAKAWPEREGDPEDGGFATKMNAMQKYVVSTTLKDPSWNNTKVINHNVAQEVAGLKQQDGGDILVYGSATLVKTLMEHNLIDEYHILLYPFMLGKGKRLFRLEQQTIVNLKEVKPFKTGVVLLTYEPKT